VADTREVLLARLAAVCGAVEGVRAVGRNTLDVAALARPAVIVQDGIEQVRDIPKGARYSEVARMELSPGLTVIVRGSDSIDPGGLPGARAGMKIGFHRCFTFSRNRTVTSDRP